MDVIIFNGAEPVDILTSEYVYHSYFPLLRDNPYLLETITYQLVYLYKSWSIKYFHLKQFEYNPCLNSTWITPEDTK